MADSTLAAQLAGHADDTVLWLGTVGATGRPTIRPVWFVATDDGLVLFSYPSSGKVRHIRTNAQVVVTFHSDPAAEHVRVVNGRAELSLDGPAPSETPGFLRKYERLYPVVGYDRASFDAAFAARITVVPTQSWGW